MGHVPEAECVAVNMSQAHDGDCELWINLLLSTVDSKNMNMTMDNDLRLQRIQNPKPWSN